MRKFLSFNLLTLSIIATFLSFILLYGYNKISDNELNKYSNEEPLINLKNENIEDLFDFYNEENNLILIIADSHLNSDSFKLIKTILNTNNIRLVIHLGDHTNYGSTEELLSAKKLLDGLDVNYVVLPGDRDLAAFGGDSEFYKIFRSIDSQSYGNSQLLFLNNSPNFTPLSESYLNKMISLIENSNFIFTSQPIFVEKGNILESKYMGSPTAFSDLDANAQKNQSKLLFQRDLLINEIRKFGGKLIVSGDHHRSSTFTDPLNSTVKYHLAGSTAKYLNSNGVEIKQEVFQKQRVSIISISKNNDYRIKEIELFEK